MDQPKKLSDLDIRSMERELQRLQQRKHLRPHEQTKVEQITGVLREQSEIRRQVAAAVSPVQTPERVGDEAGIDMLARDVEQGFGSLERRLIAGLDQRTADGRYDPSFNVAIRNPFAFINANKTNPLKNAVRLRGAAAAAHRDPRNFAWEALRDVRHFAYDIDPAILNQFQGVAAYAPQERRMILSPAFDHKNDFDLLIACHETVHMMHTAHWSRRNYVALVEHYNTMQRPGVVLQEELDAYALEIDALNLLLGDTLRTTVQQGRPIDAPAIQRKLHLRADQHSALARVLHLAERYYPEGSVSGPEKPEDYVRHAASMHLQDGYDLYHLDSGGRAVLLQQA